MFSGFQSEIFPIDEVAWGPTLNDRFVVWQGGRTQYGVVRAYDRLYKRLVDIYEITGTIKPPLASRPAAFDGGLVWLSVRAEDMNRISTVIPQFNVLELR